MIPPSFLINTCSSISKHLELIFNKSLQLGVFPDDWKTSFITPIYKILSLVLGLMILVTVIGNVFVIAAIILERNLQNVANYLVASLAVADLLVACLVMPLGAVYEISRGWILGPELCDIWTSCDVLCCTASILHLVAIATDRYWAVTNVDYIHSRTSKRVSVMIILVWVAAVIVSLAPQFGWKDKDYLQRIEQQKCMVSQDVAYQVFATFCTFYVPLFVILVLYWKIYQTARKRIRRRKPKLPIASNNNQSATSSSTTTIATGHITTVSQQVATNQTSTSCDTSDVPQPLASSIERIENACKNNCDQNLLHPPTLSTPSAPTPGTSPLHSNKNLPISTISNQISGGGSQVSTPVHPPPSGSLAQKSAISQLNKRKETLEAKRERKAAKTLAIITGAFVVCWLPFFIMALLLPLCETCEINDWVASLFLWLGYFNSTLNPVIYTIFSPEFRQAFKRILFGSHNRSTYYRRGKL
ncbi:unnamed protein product [Sphagnum compactum]